MLGVVDNSHLYPTDTAQYGGIFKLRLPCSVFCVARLQLACHVACSNQTHLPTVGLVASGRLRGQNIRCLCSPAVLILSRCQTPLLFESWAFLSCCGPLLETTETLGCLDTTALQQAKYLLLMLTCVMSSRRIQTTNNTYIAFRVHNKSIHSTIKSYLTHNYWLWSEFVCVLYWWYWLDMRLLLCFFALVLIVT